jgi:type VI protein secretion system component VasK
VIGCRTASQRYKYVKKRKLDTVTRVKRMWQIIILFLVLGLLSAVFQWIGATFFVTLFYVLLSIISFVIVFIISVSIYITYNPKMRNSYLKKIAKEAEDDRERKEQEQVEARARRERREAERQKKGT